MPLSAIKTCTIILLSIWTALGITVVPKFGLVYWVGMCWALNLMCGLYNCEFYKHPVKPMLRRRFADLFRYLLVLGAAWLVAIGMTMLNDALAQLMLNTVVAALGFIEILVMVKSIAATNPDAILTQKLLNPFITNLEGRIDQLTSKLPESHEPKTDDDATEIKG